MGATAAKYADFLVVTSDNPRTEEPGAIIQDILAGLPEGGAPYEVVENRIQAIRFALANARAGDIVLLAGKGHETYQILADGVIHLDEPGSRGRGSKRKIMVRLFRIQRGRALRRRGMGGQWMRQL